MATLYGPQSFTGTDGSPVPDITVMPSPGSNTGSSITIQGNRGRWHTGSVTNYNGRVAGRLVASAGDIELTGSFRFDGSECYPGIYWKAEAACGGRDGYALRFWPAGYYNLLVLDEWNTVGGAALATVNLTFTPNVDYSFRLRAIGTSIRARVWPTSGAEPGTWAIDLTNSYYTTPGPLYIGNSGPGVGANGIAYFDNLLVTDGVAAVEGFYPGDYPGLSEYPGGANTTSGSIAFSNAMAVAFSGTVSRLGAMALNTVSSLLISSPLTVVGNLPLGGSTELTIGVGTIEKFGGIGFTSGSDLFWEGSQETPGGDLILSTESTLFIHSPIVAAPEPGPDGTYGGGPYGAGPYGGIEFFVDEGGGVRGDILKFSPPTRRTKYDVGHRLFDRVGFDVPVSVLRTGASFREVLSPSDEEMEAADFTYLGGHDYVVDGQTGALLAQAGYGEYLTLVARMVIYPGEFLYPSPRLLPRS